MKIVFDNQTFIEQQFGGISRYFVDLLKCFEKFKINVKVIGLYTDNFNIIELSDNVRKPKNYIIPKIKGLKKIAKIFNKFFCFISASNADILHHTYYDLDFFKLKSKYHVLTVYDMIHEIFNMDENFSEVKKKCIKKADLVFAISKSTKNDIIKYVDVDPNKIKVVYLSSDLKVNRKLDNVEFKDKYIFFIGNRDGYKNFKFFIHSISDFLIENNLKLYCGGGGNFNQEELSFIESLNLSSLIFWFDINDKNYLANLYTHAQFFVFPSKYEGFGIPILEAMNCDCPIVLSDSSSMKEVASYAGYYFNPEDSDSILKSCQLVFNDEHLKKGLIEKGKKRRLDFSAFNTAKETLKFYNDIQNI
jgi:glycosyltransferase involved in cell wall biosynthesis